MFLVALEYEAGLARDSFLDTACHGDEVLRSTVNDLLQDHDSATDLFGRAAHKMLLGTLDEGYQAETSLVSGMIGPYRILRLLGEGGGGAVYEAEQDMPIRRVVALKILRPGTDARLTVALFEAEKQTLALMEHPNIARVLDAGTTEDKRPYFAMDLVHGTKITDYCAHRRLPVASRLMLMLQVFAAVQHAHNKGVIHGDLKPSNILVAEIDGVAIPKVIDFGISSVVSMPGVSDGVGKGVNHWVGTPAYMSPEQFRASGDIDTRSDIYSLGVVLYELLAGVPPYRREALSMADPDAICRSVLEEIPLPPSLLARRSACRMSKELDCIVMKAMGKDREKRYTTVQALSADVVRYLDGNAVEAYPSSRAYRLYKLTMRNRLVSATIVAAFLALVSGLSISTLQYLRALAAEHEQARLRSESEEREHVSKAAIYLMRNMIPEAEAEICQMGGILRQPSVEAANVFRTLGIMSAISEDWERSADRWFALCLVNHFDDTDMTDHASSDLLPVAPTLVRISDMKRYDEFRRLLIGRLGQTTNPVAAEQVLKLSLQSAVPPVILEELRHVAKVAESSLSADMDAPPETGLEAWRCVALGIWYYRNHQYGEAKRWCTRSLLVKDYNLSRRIQALIIRAMASKALGKLTLADEDMDYARVIYVMRFRASHELNSNGSWYDWLNARNLFVEAGQPIEQFLSPEQGRLSP